MNKEEKEIIDRLKNNANSDGYDDTGYFFELYLNEKDLLLDGIDQLEKENKQLKEKIEYLKNQKENKDKWFQLIADIGFDYDGYNDTENLKHLIDELVKFALNGRDNYEYEDIFKELESSDNND